MTNQFDLTEWSDRQGFHMLPIDVVHRHYTLTSIEPGLDRIGSVALNQERSR